MSDEPLILSFDTATNNCTIALTRRGTDNDETIASFSSCTDITHSRRLLDSIDWLMQEAGHRLADVAACAVGLGPGSFTGLRIGLATAKGLCHGGSKPLIGICSLDSIGAYIDSQKLICVVLDARKKEVYSRFYRMAGEPVARPCSEPVVMKPERLAGQIVEPVVLAGDGAEKYRQIFEDVLGDTMEQASDRYRYPSAEAIGLLAAEAYRRERFLDLATAAPLYVSSSDAELSLNTAGKGNQEQSKRAR